LKEKKIENRKLRWKRISQLSKWTGGLNLCWARQTYWKLPKVKILPEKRLCNQTSSNIVRKEKKANQEKHRNRRFENFTSPNNGTGVRKKKKLGQERIQRVRKQKNIWGGHPAPSKKKTHVANSKRSPNKGEKGLRSAEQNGSGGGQKRGDTANHRSASEEFLADRGAFLDT